jgi:molybdenum cofactor cytidylyltransferase
VTISTIKQCNRMGVLILAAGAGRRMGGRAKCLLEVDGHSLLERLVRSISSMGLRQCVLVLGQHAPDIQAHLAQWPVHFVPRQVVNPAPGDDPATSLQIGLRALDSDTQAVMVFLADQPLINATDISAVCVAFMRRSPDCHLLLPLVDEVPGHPVMFDATVLADLLAAPGTGPRHWMAVHPNEILKWVVDNPHYTRDLDTPDDIEILARETGWSFKWPRSARTE